MQIRRDRLVDRVARPRRSRFRPALIAAPAVALLAAQSIVLRPVFIDDAYIFYRYADNWANGLGPVYNRGEYVEGFSSFLWLSVLTVASAAGATLEHAAPMLGLAAAIATLLVVAAAAQRLFPEDPLLAAATTLAVLASGGLAYYAASGMDTPAFALTLVAAVLAAARFVERGADARPLAGCILLAALVLVRVEGFLYAATIAALAAVLLRRRPGGVRLAAPLLVTVAASAAVVFGARVAVYHSLVPATVSAKSAASHYLVHGDFHALLEVLRSGIRYEALPLVVALAVAAGLVRQRRRPIPSMVLICAALVALNIAITIWGGGDWMPFHRHVVAVLPLIALAAAWTAAANGEALLRSVRPGALAVAAGACIAVVGVAAAQPWRERKALGGAYAKRIGAVAAATPGTAILTDLAGALPYRAGVGTYTWDLLGLTNRHNATRGNSFSGTFGRSDYDYSFGRPWNLFVTTDTSEVAALFDRLDAGRPLGPVSLMYSKPWVRARLTVLVRPTLSISAALQSECRCPAVPLTAATRARLRVELRLPRRRRLLAPLSRRSPRGVV